LKLLKSAVSLTVQCSSNRRVLSMTSI
jgi:hypothetical protein